MRVNTALRGYLERAAKAVFEKITMRFKDGRGMLLALEKIARHE